MDNEKYGIVLELITNKFKEKMQEVKSAFTGLSDKKVNLNTNWAQLDYLRWQISEIDEKLQNPKKFNMKEGDIVKAEAQLEKLINQYDRLKAKQDNVASSSTKASLNITKGLDRMTSKIKRFGLSLLSIRSLFSLVSRASSAYLAQDTELANKLQSVWAGLGALLSPIIEGIVNVLAKAVKYIAIFIKALTGVDLLAKATAKSMAGTTKSAKSLNKALAGFDELTNLDTEASGGGADLGAGLKGLEDVKVDTKWADRIESFGKFIKTEWPTVLGLLAGITTFFQVAGPLINKFGLRIGFIKSLGIGIALTGIVMAIGSLIQYIKDPSWENFGKIIEGIGIAVIGVGIAFTGLPGIVMGVLIAIVGYVIKNWDKIKETLQNGVDWIKSKSQWVKDKIGIDAGLIYDGFARTFQRIILIFDNLFTSAKGVLDGIIQFVKGVFTGNLEMAFNGIKQIFSNVFKAISGTFSIIMDGIWDKVITISSVMADVIGAVFKGVINKTLSTIEKVLNTPIRAINSLIGIVNALPGGSKLSKLNTFNLPRLNVGTNYVPEDQVAMIHKGEAVVPKKFNSKEYFSGTNDETNAILQELIEAVKDIEINPYTTIKDVGRASLSYINGKSRQLGESVVR